MKRSILLLLAAPLLAMTACMGSTGAAPTGAVTTPPPSATATPTPVATPTPATVDTIVAKADGAVDRASAAYLRLRPTLDLLIGLLPSEYATRVIQAQSIVERSLLAAKVASTAAAQLLELRKAEAALHEIELVTGKRAAAG